jgi:hypothetical protein
VPDYFLADLASLASLTFSSLGCKWFSLVARQPDFQSRSGFPVTPTSATRLGHCQLFDWSDYSTKQPDGKMAVRNVKTFFSPPLDFRLFV